MKSFIEIFIIFLVVIIIGLIYRDHEKNISLIETQRVVKAEFYPSVEFPNSTCFKLEGSKRSFFNSNKYDESTVFKIVEAKINGKNCIRKILAGNDVLLEKHTVQGCINYEIPESFCLNTGTRYHRCVEVRDHCY